MYCVYLTVYKGNKLPPFYIGQTSITKISKNYHGSVKSKQYKQIWEQELVENNYLFETKVLKKFDIRKDALAYEEYIQRAFNVHTNPMFINKALSNKAFVCADHNYVSERMKRNNPNKNGMSIEHRRKISESNKGKKMSREAVELTRASKIGKKHTREHVEKVRKALIGRKCTPEHIEKVRQSKIGKKLINGKMV